MNKNYTAFFHKISGFLVIWIPVLILLLSACELVATPEPSGKISFVDYTDSKHILNGQEGLIDFGGKLVEMGDRAIKPLKIKNSGEGDLVITNITIVNTVGTGFGFADDVVPDFPLVIPSGKTIDDVFIEFAPDTGGEFKGSVFIETDKGTNYFDLAGIGLWQLTLTVAGSGDDSRGKITSPVEVTPGNSKIVTSSSGVFELACIIDDFYGLNKWVEPVINYPTPSYENQSALETRITLYTHTEISLEIVKNWNIVPDDFVSIQAAINDAVTKNNAVPETILGVVVRTSYNPANDNAGINIAAGIPILGGYAAAGDSRSKIDRTVNPTTIDDPILVSGSNLLSNTIIEGFIINGNVTFRSKTKAVLQYNTINGSGTSPAVTINNASNLIQNNVINGGSGGAESVGLFITNSGAPKIFNNIITAGTTSADYSKTYGIKVTEGSNPVIYKNTINAGTAGGKASQSFGVFNDFECEPLITGNTIYGGTAAGSSGQSYGVYMINNGTVTAGYNTVNGGAGETAYGFYVYQGGNLYLDYNNIRFTSSGNIQYGVYIGFNGRVRRLKNSGLYDCKTSLLHDYWDGDITDIDDVNDRFHTDTNSDGIQVITIPDSPDYE